jgi:hypothetical protein
MAIIVASTITTTTTMTILSLKIIITIITSTMTPTLHSATRLKSSPWIHLQLMAQYGKQMIVEGSTTNVQLSMET